MFSQALRLVIRPTIGETAPIFARTRSRPRHGSALVGSPKSSSSSSLSQRALSIAVTRCAFASSSGTCTRVTLPFGTVTVSSRPGVFRT